MSRGFTKAQFLAADIIPLADKYGKHHRAREAFYRTQYEEAEKNLKEKGVEMMEAAAIFASGAITGFGQGGRSLVPQLKQEYVDKVTDAKNKINDHKNKADEYENAVRVYSAITKNAKYFSVELTAADILFFHLDEL